MRLLSIAILLFILSGCEFSPQTAVDDERGPALVDIQDKTWRFADYHGKWIIVNYWASWCKPCITEVPELEAFHQAHQQTDAVVLGVNYDFVSPAETAALAQEYGIHYFVLPSASDPREQLGVDPIMVLPSTFIINPEGKVVATLIGEQTQASLEKEMRQ